MDLIDCSIAYEIRGFPAKIRVFLFLTPFEPPRAAIKQIGFNTC